MGGNRHIILTGAKELMETHGGQENRSRRSIRPANRITTQAIRPACPTTLNTYYSHSRAIAQTRPHDSYSHDSYSHDPYSHDSYNLAPSPAPLRIRAHHRSSPLCAPPPILCYPIRLTLHTWMLISITARGHVP